MSTEPFSFAASVKAAFEAVHAAWKNGSVLLWSFGAAAAVALAVLLLAQRLHFEGAAELNKQYDTYLLLAAAVLWVLAAFKTYSERKKLPLVFIGNEQRSHWGQARQSSGQVFTAIALDFQVTNFSDSAVQLATIRLRWPWVSSRKILQTVLFVEDPRRGTYGRNPIAPHSLAPCSAHITVGRPIGRPGKHMNITVAIQDNAGRWYRLKLRHVTSMPTGPSPPAR